MRVYTDSPEDLQEIVDVIIRGLRSQNFERSLNMRGACAVRGLNGRKCAAGWLVPDDEYRKAHENMDTLFADVMQTHHYRDDTRRGALVSELQQIHDLSTQPSDMEGALRFAVARNKLEWPT